MARVMGLQWLRRGESLGKGSQGDTKAGKKIVETGGTAIENRVIWLGDSAVLLGAHTLSVSRAEGHARSARPT
jgi:hypothetical protein